MEYAFGEENGVRMVTLSGRVTYGEAPKVHDIISQWDFKAHPTIVIDMRYVTFIDSTAIGMLFLIAKHAREAKGELVLRNPAALVAKTLRRAAVETCAKIEPQSDKTD